MYLRQRVATTSVETGRRVIVNVWGRQILTATLQGRSSIEGLPELRTDADERVNRLDKGRYQVVQTGEILESSDPDAF